MEGWSACGVEGGEVRGVQGGGWRACRGVRAGVLDGGCERVERGGVR